MARQPNNWRGKREEQHDAHNRKPGSAKYWKNRSSKTARRGTARIYRNMVDEPGQRFIRLNLQRSMKQKEAAGAPDVPASRPSGQRLYRLVDLARVVSDS